MDDARASELLRADRERIERALAAIQSGHTRGDDEDERVDQHLADQATELYDKSFDQGHAEELRAQLTAVERAEKRLEEGTFGRSIDSGEPIPDARLEIVPTAERTVEEQGRYERGG
ncbi:MAG TPA: TraR/DksA C4-type zinc finger protein [Solirubrobacteraceae bacterium]